MLHRLIYCSQSTRALSALDLTELLNASRERNGVLDVTGMLLYCEESFLQLVEGPKADVDTVWASIQRDPRHGQLRVLEYLGVDRRRFDDWSMGFAHLESRLLQQAVPGYVAPTKFPLVSPQLVRDARVAESLLRLYARNRHA